MTSSTVLLVVLASVMVVVFEDSLTSYTNVSLFDLLMTVLTFAVMIGWIVGLVVVNLLDSSVAMVFVCYAESPDALKVC